MAPDSFVFIPRVSFVPVVFVVLMSVMFCAMTELAPIAEIVTVNDARTATNMTLHRLFNSVVHMHMSI